MLRRLMFLGLTILAAKNGVVSAQDSASRPKKAVDSFFQSQTPLDITITVNLKRLRADRGDSVPWRSATISAPSADGQLRTIPVKLRTRGIWRRKKCDYPPIRMNFAKGSARGSEFEGLDKPKLVSFCRDNDLHEQYILQEFQLYRIYQLMTPHSHKVRLVRMSYVDSASGKLEAKRYAIVLEEPDALAARFKAKILEQKGARADDLDEYKNAIFGLFQFMIGNTDVSISALHNAELLALPEGLLVPVAYDFDFSGAVNATYATPEPKLHIENVRTRLFRGYCVNPEELTRAVATLNAQKDAVFALYDDPIGRLIPPRLKDPAREYFTDFYKTINNPRELKHQVVDNCISRVKSDAPNIAQ